MIGIGYLLLGIFVLLAPGFLLSFLLFSKPKSLDIEERLATSVGLSALADMLIIVILSQPSLSALRLVPFIGVVLILCGVLGVIIFFRKKSLHTFVDFFSHSESKE